MQFATTIGRPGALPCGAPLRNGGTRSTGVQDASALIDLHPVDCHLHLAVADALAGYRGGVARPRSTERDVKQKVHRLVRYQRRVRDLPDLNVVDVEGDRFGRPLEAVDVELL